MATKTRRGRQRQIPGMENPSIPKIDKLAEEYREASNDRKSYQEVEKTKQDLLFAAMTEAGLTRYEYDDQVVELAKTEKVKVSRKKEVKREIDVSENGDEVE